MIHIENISNRDRELLSGRRGFLKGNARSRGVCTQRTADAGPVVWPNASAASSEGDEQRGVAAKRYLAIDTDGTAYIIAHRSEMGSGSRTALPRIVAEASWMLTGRA